MILGLRIFQTSLPSLVLNIKQITVNKINEIMLVFNTRFPKQNNMTCRMNYSLLQMTNHAIDNLFQLDCA